MVQDLCRGQWVLFCISTVVVDPVDDKLLLFGRQEAVCFCWKINDDEPSNSTHSDRDSALDNKDPYMLAS